MSGAGKSAVMENQLSIFDRDAMNPMRPEDRVDMVSVWASRNRRTWHRLRELLEREARDTGRIVYLEGRDGSAVLGDDGEPVIDHRVPVRRGDVFNIAQHHGMRISEAREFRFDNNMWSVLSRAAIMACPVIGLVVNPKTCDVDTVDIRAVWQRHNPRDDFYFGTWREAKDNAEDFL